MKVNFKLFDTKYTLDATNYGVDIFKNGEYRTTIHNEIKHFPSGYWIGKGIEWILEYENVRVYETVDKPQYLNADHSLCKLEEEVFPYGYVDFPRLETFSSVPIKERISRLEKKLGVVQTPSDDFDRLKNCENCLKSIKKELNILDEKVFSTREDIHDMKPVITIDGQIKRLEDKLGVLDYNPNATMLHRWERLKNAWSCRKKSTYIPKYKAGETVEVKHILLENSPRFVEIWLEQTIAEVKPLNNPITLTIRLTYIFEDGSKLFCDWADKSDCVRKVKVTHQPVAWEG
jgi:hypothetical protein